MPWGVGSLVLVFLMLFLVLPVGSVLHAVVLDTDGSWTLGHFEAFFAQGLMREAFFNSAYVAAMSTALAAVLAVPLAYLAVRFQFRGSVLIQSLGLLPLVLPPFVGAVAMQLIFGRSGTVNLLLQEYLGWTVPFMDGLNGVIFVEGLHYFPFILLNLTVAWGRIDGAAEEAAMTLGCTGWRLFRRVILPLGLPGLVAGASLVFVKVFDDLGTPLVLGSTNLLAPQAYLRITQLGAEDPLGYVIGVIMVAFSVCVMSLSSLSLKRMDFAPLSAAPTYGGEGLRRRALGRRGAVLAYAWVFFVMGLVLSPHVGVLLLSFGSIWSFAPLPDAFTLAHYATVFDDAAGMLKNTLLYCGLAAGLDVLLGTAIAYLLMRTSLPGRRWLAGLSTATLAVPGIVVAIGYLRFYKGVVVPGSDVLLTGTWVVIMLAYAVRRLPYALRSCMVALQQVPPAFEEAAHSLGGTSLRTLRRIVLPLMAGGLAAAFITSFVTAAVELSATMMLVSAESQVPMSYGIYLYMQSVAGRGPAAALGVLSILVVALGTWASHAFLRRADRMTPVGAGVERPLWPADGFPGLAAPAQMPLRRRPPGAAYSTRLEQAP